MCERRASGEQLHVVKMDSNWKTMAAAKSRDRGSRGIVTAFHSTFNVHPQCPNPCKMLRSFGTFVCFTVLFQRAGAGCTEGMGHD